jgi:hypothetical protein
MVGNTANTQKQKRGHLAHMCAPAQKAFYIAAVLAVDTCVSHTWTIDVSAHRILVGYGHCLTNIIDDPVRYTCL